MLKKCIAIMLVSLLVVVTIPVGAIKEEDELDGRVRGSSSVINNPGSIGRIPVVLSSGDSLEEETTTETTTEGPGTGEGEGEGEGDADLPTTGTDPLPSTGISVSVPMYLPVKIKASGSVEVASNAKIINYSGDSIKVDNILMSSANGWSVVSFTDKFHLMPVNEKKVGLSINGDLTQEDGSLDFSPRKWEEIQDGANNYLPINYKANLAPQSEEVDASTIANVIFIVGWVY